MMNDVKTLDEEHEAHGFCTVCHTPVHKYPFGWLHVQGGAYLGEKHDLMVQVNCCEKHATSEARTMLADQIMSLHYGPNGVGVLPTHQSTRQIVDWLVANPDAVKKIYENVR